MSALLLPEPVEVELKRPRTRTRAHGSVSTKARRRVSTQVKVRRRPRPGNRVASWAGVWCSVALMTYACSALLANCQMEAARRDALRATERAKLAKAEVARLQGEISRLSSLGAIDQWAVSRGFVAREYVAQPRTVEGLGRVASNR